MSKHLDKCHFTLKFIQSSIISGLEYFYQLFKKKVNFVYYEKTQNKERKIAK